MIKKRILIIGASGFIGFNLYRTMKSSLNNYQIIGTCFQKCQHEEFKKLDLKNFSEIEAILLTYKPDFIIFAAGNKDVKSCEQNLESALAINTYPIMHFVEIFKKHKLNTHFIYISTDYVFNGKDGNFRDFDRPNPDTNYGESKYEAEKILIASKIDYKIIRTSAVIGHGSPFLDWLINELNFSDLVNMYNNIFFTPTPINYFSDTIKELIIHYDKISKKIIHIVGENKYSRYDFAQLIRKKITSHCRIISSRYTIDDSCFQLDLSMIPSEIIVKWKVKTDDEYLEEILREYGKN